MEFESPDVERDFPGLYASESRKRSDASDFSDDSHEKVSKKDLLIGKRKDKKDSKKDRGYATLEGESSPEEDPDIKSPSKSKKSKTFKFTSKKEKREKSREKDLKDDKEKDKKKNDDKDKEKKKEKVKLKLKDKKKSKQDDSSDMEDHPVFGVPLAVAMERNRCHDGVEIPLVVRQCIDHVQQTGLLAENVYKVSGIKSRVQHVKKLYNLREPVSLVDYDLPVATSLLKLFLRELPEPVFTSELMTRFEEAGSIQDVTSRGRELQSLVDLLPLHNRTLLAWLIKHFDAVASHEKHNKMNAQCIAMTLSPVLQCSQRLISALLCHASNVFHDVILSRYVPPQTSATLKLPDSCVAISEELRKQESLLEQLHCEMNKGLITKSREEQLWEVQRIITQLKRKLRSLERSCGGSSGQRSLDDTDCSLRTEPEELNLRLQAAPSPDQLRRDSSPVKVPEPKPAEPKVPDTVKEVVKQAELRPPPELFKHPGEPVRVPTEPPRPEVKSSPWPDKPNSSPHLSDHSPSARRDTDSSSSNSTASQPTFNHFKQMTAESLEVEDINRPAIQLLEKKQVAVLETEELTNVIINLRALCELEQKEINRLKNKISQLGGNPDICSFDSDDSDHESKEPGSFNFEKNGIIQKRRLLRRETKMLQTQKDALVKDICSECDACINLRVQVKLLQMNKHPH